MGKVSRLMEFAIALEETAHQISSPIQKTKPSCRKGCSACCRQPVPISESEAFGLRDTLLKMSPNRRFQIFRRMGHHYHLWKKNRPEQETPFHHLREYWSLGMDCPFLVDQGCSIHPNRPLVCREHLVSSDPVYCDDVENNSVTLINPLLAIREALDQASSFFLNKARVAIPLAFLSQWLREHRNILEPRYSEREMAEFLIKKLGGICWMKP